MRYRVRPNSRLYRAALLAAPCLGGLPGRLGKRGLASFYEVLMKL